MIVPQDQMITSQARPKWFPRSAFLSPGGCLWTVGTSKANFTLHSAEVQLLHNKVLCPSPLLSVYLSCCLRKQALAFRLLSHMSAASMPPQIQRIYIQLFYWSRGNPTSYLGDKSILPIPLAFVGRLDRQVLMNIKRIQTILFTNSISP